MKSSIDFLTQIYEKQCEDGDYIILSVKGPNIKWIDVPITYKSSNISEKLSQFFHKYDPSKYDLYWSPMAYSSPNRRISSSLDTKYLVNDIDEHDSPNSIKPKPTYIWESSPNKYQGIWEMDRYIKEPEYTPLNKSLAQFIGADDCYDWTHVYRIPGTRNHKYKNKPMVELPRFNKTIYRPKNLKSLVGQVEETKRDGILDQNLSLTERKIYAKYNIPQKVMDLLAMENIDSIDRSDTIWYIENKLHELGMSPNEIILLVKNSSFNKYKDRADGDKRLKAELQKIISGKVVISNKVDKELTGFKLDTFKSIMSDTSDFGGWLIKGFWGKASHGIISGMPKCFKSTLVHDLAVSVASGKPFLNQYEVETQGPVLMVQNENANYIIRDRTEKMLAHKDVMGKVKISKDRKSLNVTLAPDLPITFVNQQGFMLTNAEHQAQLEKVIAETKPVLIIFDPLYLMFEGDLNSAKDLNPTLSWLIKIKEKYNTAVILIHHYNKGGTSSGKGGARMMGSIILYGWIDSAWYLAKEAHENGATMDYDDSDFNKVSKEPTVVELAREFRFTGSYPNVDLHISMGAIGDCTYDVDVTRSGDTSSKKGNIVNSVLNALSMTTAPVSAAKLSEQLGINRNKLRSVIDGLLDSKKIMARSDGFIIYKTNNS